MPQPPPTTHPVPDGATLLLVTDGLIEVPGEHLATGLEALRTVYADAPPSPDSIGDLLLSTFAKAQSDDVALLVARLHHS